MYCESDQPARLQQATEFLQPSGKCRRREMAKEGSDKNAVECFVALQGVGIGGGDKAVYSELGLLKSHSISLNIGDPYTSGGQLLHQKPGEPAIAASKIEKRRHAFE